ncbi:Hypothetical protein I595_1935 [Croceitalea dokdonensis DOKDO 023]|uniref:Uncharacterized protein n=1 Tax=Croceitalea dokdonensis DOKDO 023 TaxID=1300341 RepID=A0A0P7AW76_9FLAO|nr:Hypothetical protein I595_1935 [Croceitalea dokdonensis DOKDO 023]
MIDGINSYNLTKHLAQAPTWTPLEFATKDINGTLLGGV